MRIAVCGLGGMGKPILDLFRAKGFDAIGYDVVKEKTECAIEEVAKAEAGVFIVPTPSLPDGSFSNWHLFQAIREFKKHVSRDFLYIITSTTVPGSCDKFRQVVGDNVCYKPEYIRLAFVRQDLLTQPLILIGEGPWREPGDRCEAIYRKVSDAPVVRMSLIEAELAKITLNIALTMKISLANQLHLVAQRLGADSQSIMRAVGADPRIGHDYLEPGWPYAGPCLPRDNRMFQYVAKTVGVDAVLSKAADQINERL